MLWIVNVVMAPSFAVYVSVASEISVDQPIHQTRELTVNWVPTLGTERATNFIPQSFPATSCFPFELLCLKTHRLKRVIRFRTVMLDILVLWVK